MRLSTEAAVEKLERKSELMLHREGYLSKKGSLENKTFERLYQSLIFEMLRQKIYSVRLSDFPLKQ